MTGRVLVGCRGWRHRAWSPGFYPEELPDDWRFCYYSNELRSVLVPYPEIFSGEPVEWRRDCDEEFRFVFEYPAREGIDTDAIAGIEQLLMRIRPVADRTAAVLVSVAPLRPVSERDLARLLEVVRDFPLCVDISKLRNRDVLRASLHRSAVGQVWHPMCDPDTPIGGFQIALAGHVDAPRLRAVLEGLRRHAEGGRGAALYFTHPKRAPEWARQARTMAEIMGI